MKRLMVCIAGVLLAGMAGAHAQGFPSRPITMTVGFAAGGPADTVARIVAEGMRRTLGQSVVIENVTGAAGNVATQRVVRSTPDGTTLSFGSLTTHVFNGAMSQLPFDLLTDLEPVGIVVFQPLMLVGKKASPVNDLPGLVAWLKQNPGAASAGSSGTGSAPHAYGLLFQAETGTRFTFVPYRGTGPAMQDLVAGQLDMLMDLAANAVPQVHAGAIKAYAVTSAKRMTVAPDVPTVTEAGFPNLTFQLWQGIWAPKGTPKDVIAKLNAAVTDSLADPAVRQRLTDLGQDLPTREQQTPAWFGGFHKSEIDKWGPILKAAGVKAQ